MEKSSECCPSGRAGFGADEDSCAEVGSAVVVVVVVVVVRVIPVRGEGGGLDSVDQSSTDQRHSRRRKPPSPRR